MKRNRKKKRREEKRKAKKKERRNFVNSPTVNKGSINKMEL